jgi:glycosyltransferase involved in cell wall biosynthesis
MITFGITVADELFEFKRLINSLQPYVYPQEEIVVLADGNKVTEEIIKHCDLCGIKIHFFNFENDFSKFKNKLFDLSSKEYLFQIDADEQIPPSLIHILRQVSSQKKVDLLWVPRINIVQGATEQDVKDFSWDINELGWEGFPDFQSRLVSTKGHIKWENKVHEILKGAKNQARVEEKPIELYSILHVKHIDKQKKQNEFYGTI